MIQLEIQPHVTKINYFGADVRMHHEKNIKKIVTYEYKDAAFRRYKQFSNSHKCLFVRQKFPTGYLAELLQYLRDNKIAHSFKGNGAAPEVPPAVCTIDGLTYRGYQGQIIESGLHTNRAVVQLPPGVGKTEILFGLVASFGKPTLWMCPSVNVLAQTEERWKKAGSTTPVDFVFPQAFIKRVKAKNGSMETNLARYKTLVIDECHHTTAHSWYELAINCPAPHRFAASATPKSFQASMELNAAIGHRQYSIPYIYFYDGQYLSRPVVRMVNYNTPPMVDLPHRYLEGAEMPVVQWDKLYAWGIAQSNHRNDYAIREVVRYKDMGFNPLVICRLVDKHVEPFSNRLRNLGLTVGAITGASSIDVRKRAIDQLLSKELDVLVSSKILGEGQDMPDLSAVINLVGGDSEVQTTQIAGRVMRPNSPAFITDFVDCQHSILKRHSESRRLSYAAMDAVIEDV